MLSVPRMCVLGADLHVPGKKDAQVCGLATRLLRKWNLVVNGTEGYASTYAYCVSTRAFGTLDERKKEEKKTVLEM